MIQSVWTQSGRLVLALSALWAVLAAPAYLVGGAAALVGLTVAVLVCLLPGFVVIALQAGPMNAQQPVFSLLAGMGLRMLFVVMCVLFAREAYPDLPVTAFVAWLVPAYLVALTVETRIALSQVQRRGSSSLESSRLYGTGTH